MMIALLINPHTKPTAHAISIASGIGVWGAAFKTMAET
jgi:hypothetical protein